MPYLLRSLLLLGVTLLWLLPLQTQARMLGVTVSPKQTTADVTQGLSFPVRWRVSTTPAHSGGAFSAQGQIIDPITQGVLLSITHPLKQADGAGPFGFEETLTLTPAQLQEWQAKGISAVRYQRSFGSASQESLIVTGDLMIQLAGAEEPNLPRSPSAGLFIHKLTLRHENTRNMRSVRANSPLRARVDVHYSGTGLLQGEWQVAQAKAGEPPLYKPLLSVRKQLPLGRREYLISPALPTAEAGVYRVRFCVIPLLVTPDQLGLDPQCPEPELASELLYRVGVDTSRTSAEIELVTSRAITLTPTTPLQWQPLPEAVVYQLQIYRSNGSAELDGADFVLRMISAGHDSRLFLSDWARQQLVPGERYRWRVTAHDANAQLIGTSALAEFTYMP